VSVTVRFYAAARKAAGVSELQLEPATAMQVLDKAVEVHPNLAQVLPQCSFLLNEIALHDLNTQILDNATLDVLPPFAGG
jgi:molybdopterin converting factor small subunit